MVFGRSRQRKLEQELLDLKRKKEQELLDLKRKKEQAEEDNRWQSLQIRLARQRQKDEEENRQREDEEAQRLQEVETKRIQELRQQRLERMKLTTPEALRNLRALIRTRYQLDAHIWVLRGARSADRPYVVEQMERADAVLMEILTTVDAWEENDRMWTAEEWKLAREIKERIMAEGKVWWENNPPWNIN